MQILLWEINKGTALGGKTCNTKTLEVCVLCFVLMSAGTSFIGNPLNIQHFCTMYHQAHHL